MYKKSGHSWPTAYEATKQNFGLSDDAIGVFAIQLRFDLDDIKNVAADSITGGGEDRKCDVLYIDKEMGVAVMAQCYVAQKEKPAAKSDKAADLNTAASWLLSADLQTLPDGLRGRAEELREAIKDGSIKQIHAWYVHNLPQSANVQKELQTVESTIRSALKHYDSGSEINVFASEIGTNELETLYTQAERTIIVTDDFDIVVPDTLERVEENWSSLTTFVPGAWISDLYNKYKTDLFSANLRGYLGSRESDSNINNGIKGTAKDEPENFSVYNNGITALVHEYTVGKKTSKGKKLNIKSISIVNGAQTTGSISSVGGAVDPRLMVSIRFVKATSDDLIENIVKYNNSQNKLQAADFRSNDPIQDRLRSEFSTIPDADYEGGRRGGASDAIKRSKYTLPSYTVGQALAAFHGEPVLAYDRKSELWTNEKNYRSIFTDRTTARHIVFCYSILEAVNNRRLKLVAKAKSGGEGLTELERKTLDFLEKKGSAFLVIYVVAQCLETIIGKPIPNRFDIKFKSNLSPSSAAAKWEPILDVVLSLANQLDSAFSRGRVTTEAVKKTVPNFVGIFASIANLQKDTFAAFASQLTTSS